MRIFLQTLMSVKTDLYVNMSVSTPLDHLIASVMKDIHWKMMQEHAQMLTSAQQT